MTTPEQAADNAAEILTAARQCERDCERAAALVGIADGWTQLYTALKAGQSKPATVYMSDTVIRNDPDMTIREEEIEGLPVVIVPEKAREMLIALGWTPPVEDAP